MGKILVKNIEITVVNSGGEDYICLTDMVKHEEGIN